MRIALPQTNPTSGNMPANIKDHLDWIEQAVAQKADLNVFPELSLTGYEPKLSNALATTQDDPRFVVFQEMSDAHDVTICLGAPTRQKHGLCISMIIFQSSVSPKTYSKQLLHSDELPYFTPGTEQLMFVVKGIKVAPAICYESLQPAHAQNASDLGAQLYIASVAKSKSGIEEASAYYLKIAETLGMSVAMVNCLGKCDQFESAGGTGLWGEEYGVVKAEL